MNSPMTTVHDSVGRRQISNREREVLDEWWVREWIEGGHREGSVG